MEIDLALLADAATIDASGKLNILGIFDRIGVTQFPAQHGGLPSYCGSPRARLRSVLTRYTFGCRIPTAQKSCH